ncbi:MULTISPECIES: hypothetical protein [unclassified Granulicatella]|uniref:hypothetical protein n=1 Tax=unclassified Granulicatella TaxID=2630493 RepID=UPI001072FC9C|nr:MULTISPECIES: hypothetical protein [unclassified Granulicatella]MBF0781033.1 hypothetical protein [Granulicatella sp. 19428wC4_WM01]TFU92456.1 hypothetical protein E4T68_07945 [Granulicatella sp. WM01]
MKNIEIKDLIRFLHEYEDLYSDRESAIQDFIKDTHVKDKKHPLSFSIEQIEQQTLGNPIKFLQRLGKLEQIEHEKWEKSRQRNEYYSDEWAYFDLKNILAEFYLDTQFNHLAKKHFQELSIMEPTNYFDVTYKLMIIYCRLGELTCIEDVMKQSGSLDDQRLVFLAMLGYLSHLEFVKAKAMAARLFQLNQNILNMINDDIFTFSHYEHDLEYLEDLEEEEFDMVETLSYVVYLMSDYVQDWINQEFNQLKKVKKINNQRFFVTPIQHSSKLFEGVSKRVVNIFMQEGLYSEKHFLEKTVEDILSIRGVGISTIKQLEKNGVLFKKI